MRGELEIKAAIKVDDAQHGGMRKMSARFGLYLDNRNQWCYYVAPEHAVLSTPKYSGKVKDMKKVFNKRRIICQCSNGRNITIDAENPNSKQDEEKVVNIGNRLQEILKSPDETGVSRGQVPTPVPLRPLNSNPAFRVTPLVRNVHRTPPTKSPPQASTPGKKEAASPGGSSTIEISPRQTSPETPRSVSSLSTVGSFATSALKSAGQKAASFFSKSSSSGSGHTPLVSGRKFYGNSSTGLTNTMIRSGGVRQPGLLRNPVPRRHLSSVSSYTWKSPSLTPTERSQPLQGFSNLGNTCYMNAILQSLFGLDTFSLDISQLVAEMKESGAENTRTLVSSLNRLVRAKKQHVGYDIQRQLLSNVKSTISAKARRFSGHYQHDAHEFLCQVLDQLKEEVIKVSKVFSGVEGQEVDQIKDLFMNPTVLNFEFQVTHTISCIECGAEVSKEESFHDLSLDMPRNKDPDKPCSIQDALDLFFRSEVVDYICEQCKGQKSDVVHRFSKLPRILVLHLKRYNFMNPASNGKLGRSIEIPRYLTLQSQCTQTTSPCFPLTSWMPGVFGSHLKESHGKKTQIGEKTKRQLNFSAGFRESTLVESPEKTTVTPTKSLKSSVTPRTPTPTKTSTSSFEDSENQDDFLSEIAALENNDFEMGDTNKQEHSKGTFGTKRKSGDGGLLQGGRNVVTPPCKKAKTFEWEIYVDAEQPTQAVDSEFDGAKSTQTETSDCDNKENAAPEEEKKEKEVGEIEMSEEEQLRQAMANSMSDLELLEQEDEDLRKAKAMSLQAWEDLDAEYNPDDFGEVFERSANETKVLQENAKTGDLPYSYRLMSVVSHLGSSSSAGHYISDVYNIKKKQWFSFDDTNVTRTTEEDVCRERQRTGYIFFYMSKDLLADLNDTIVSLENRAQEVKRSQILSVMSV